ncbi:MAG: hypothetical protein ACYC3H_03555 [Bellilinea sp.]
MTAKLTVTISDSEYAALSALAWRERRNPRNQAAVLLKSELERRGLLVKDEAITSEKTAAGVVTS